MSVFACLSDSVCLFICPFNCLFLFVLFLILAYYQKWRIQMNIQYKLCLKITRTGPEMYFSQNVLLMYGTNCLNILVLDRYHCPCEKCIAWIYLRYAFITVVLRLVYLIGNFQMHCCPVFWQIKMTMTTMIIMIMYEGVC